MTSHENKELFALLVEKHSFAIFIIYHIAKLNRRHFPLSVLLKSQSILLVFQVQLIQSQTQFYIKEKKINGHKKKGTKKGRTGR